MVLSWSLGVWRVVFFALLLCGQEESVTVRADPHAGSETAQEPGKQPPLKDQHQQTGDDTANSEGASHRSRNGHRDKTMAKENPTNSKLSKDGNTRDGTSATTNHKQASAESHHSQQPIRDNQLNAEKAQPPSVESPSGDSIRQEVSSNEHEAPNDAKGGGGGAEISIGGQGSSEDGKTRQGGKQSRETDETTAGSDGGPEATGHSDSDAAKVTTPTDQKANPIKEQVEVPAPNVIGENLQPGLVASDSQEDKHVETDTTSAAEDGATLAAPASESVSRFAEIERTAQQIHQDEPSAGSLREAIPASQLAGEEAAKKAQLETHDSATLPKQEDSAGKNVSTEKEPSIKSVEGASPGDKDTIFKDSPAAETPEGSITEDSIYKDVSAEKPKDADEEVAAPHDEDDTRKEDKEKMEGEERKKEEGDEDEMPSFDEWKQKMLEQHEQEKQQGQGGQGSAAPPPRPFSLTENSKNHASSDCGAKILNVNKEAQNAPAILQSNRDVYTLNPCSASIWFTVELCEPIQVKYLEIANYELFSSVPKSFRVSISDRFPTREWRQLGTFHAREERSLQSFPVHEEQIFAKYIKIEMLTFFGNEHYCPLSTLRIFGTSMVEEIDEENIGQDAIHEEPEVLPAHPTPVPEEDDNGLLQSAKGLVRNIMNVITGNGNGKDATPCDNKNKSCTEAEEMLPCMPEDEPKELSKHSNVSEGEEQRCSAQNMSDFSLDPIQFQRECRGATWCFSPNYGQQFQDCCVREVPASMYTMQSFLCCKDVLAKSLYRSVQTLEPLKVLTDPLESEVDIGRASQEKIPKHLETKQTEIEVEEKTAEKERVKSKDQTQSVVTPQGDGPTPLASGAKSSLPSTSSEIPAQRQSKSQAKPSSSLPAPVVATAGAGPKLPAPTPSLKPTCGTVPVDQPQVTLLPPISIQPTVSQEEKERQEQTGTEQVPAADTDKPVTQVEPKKPPSVEPSRVGDPVAGSVEEDTPKVEEQSIEAGDEPAVKTPPEESTSKESKAPVASSGIASKDLQSSADAEKPGPPTTPDKSRQADATEEEAGKLVTSTEATSGIKPETKETKETKDTPKVEPVVKTPESIKSETREPNGRGTKAIPEPNGVGGIGSMGAAQKESVFMRLNNRIKSLELNMSLSSRYLEELSQRYRKQMDEMQKAFNKTIKKLTENAHKAEEKDQKQQEYITRLEGQMSEVMANLESTNDRLNSMHKEVIERHLFLMVVEILLMSILFLLCLRRLRRGRYVSGHTPPVVVRSHDNGVRRNSLPSTPVAKGKNNNVSPRVSERTISGGSCDDLLIIGPSTPFLEAMKQAPEPARHKPKNKAKHKPPAKSVSSNSTLQHNRQTGIPPKQSSKMTVAGVLFRGPAFSGSQTPPDSPTDPIHRTVSAEELQSRVQDVKGGAPPIRQQHAKAGMKQPGKKHGVMMNGRR